MINWGKSYRTTRETMDLAGIVESAHCNLGTAQLIEKAIRRNEGMLSGGGAFVVGTGQFTGRSPKDKYVVREPDTENTVNWGTVNQPLPEGSFEGSYHRLQ